jgi:hypothetical protein
LHGAHGMDRGNSDHAGRLLRAIIANHDQPVAAHDIAAQTPSAALPERVRSIRDRRAAAVQRRRATYQTLASGLAELRPDLTKAQERHSSRSRSRGLDYGIEI